MSSGIGVIDIGSNAVRMGFGNSESSEFIECYRVPVRLGQDSFGSGRISEEKKQLLFEALSQFHQVFKENQISNWRVVATSALRNASNKEDIVKHVSEQFGMKLEIINQEEEAQLIHNAIDPYINYQRIEAFCLILVGEALNLFSQKKGKLERSLGLKLGTLRLLNSCPADKSIRKALGDLIDEGLAPLKSDKKFLKEPSSVLIATGGNPRTLGRVRRDFLNKKSRGKIHYEELEMIVEELFARSYRQRIKDFDLRTDRADVILPASLLMLKTMNLMEVDTLMLPEAGLKMGFLTV